MDKLKHYRQIIQETLTEYHQINEKSGSQTESVLAFDEVHEQYLLLLMGWHKDERIKSVMIHIRLKDNKIWIEEDWTENGVATDLLHKGITREEIVLGFHPPLMRQYTEFAIA
ncbi:XisI protein [Sphaerospermopsis kisseleviana CS-549]|uniref:XisI-like fdxN element excision controlling factor protein n=2 Tax=Sphaerospermopsis TaxID=752201 RepID=A0A479ZQZ7_9CYAN|nr:MULTISPECIES: XisI protein [Sphaerospermopsis]MBD2135773.1 XisI protein [Sphaerospermopsis sp. FACHB-1094]MDB9441567.1 XisI protein [Sphaerospermopsis kisseleviana CS-549]BAZ83659.1 fdxN element excision controlling factor XisI-like protein [Sphaerospermopsis kisseleviana NIES-73]GCL35119.1 XisI-like fdxN element excision controlling factor protein [Sphaerospermopsis reniformis]